MLGLLTLGMFVYSAALFSRCFAAKLLERLLSGYLILTLEIYAVALLLSSATQLSHPLLWCAGGVIFLAASRPAGDWPQLRISHPQWAKQSTVLFLLLAFPLALAFCSAFFTVPGNWDALSYHLPRALYFLQFDSFADFPSAYWAQSTHPILGSVWLIFQVITFGKVEPLFFLPQFLAWIMAALAAYGITDILFSKLKRQPVNKAVAAFLTLTLALLPLMEVLGASTERNDLLVTAYGAVSFYFLVSEVRLAVLLSLAALSFALAVKATALPLLPVWIVVYLVWIRRKPSRADGIAVALAIAVFLNCGYGKMALRYGSLIGPPAVTSQHRFESLAEAWKEGKKNIFRFAIDAGTPDGWPGIPMADKLVAQWRSNALRASNFLLGDDLRMGKRYGEFEEKRLSLSHEDPVYYGLAYVMLAFFATVVFFWKEAERKLLLLWQLPALAIFLIHAFTVWYDPWHGRFFLVALVFSVPMLARGLERSWQHGFLRIICILLLGFLYAQTAYALTMRNNQPLFLGGSRLEKIFRNRPDLLPVYQAVDATVSSDAVLAICLPEDQPEYALFGPHLNRLVISVFDFARGKLPVPPGAEWLFFHSSLEPARESDIPLGQKYFLRKLSRP